MVISDNLRAAQQAWRRLWDKGQARDAKKQGNKPNKRRKKRDKHDTYNQTTMLGTNMDINDAETFGDAQTSKRPNVFRCGFQNVNNLQEDSRTSKSRQLVDFVVQKDYDCFMMAEIGLNWRKIGADNRWFERIVGKFKSSRSVFAHNVTELQRTKVLQPGGVGMISTDEVTSRVVDSGTDPTGLGRWCWTRFQGRNGVQVRTISVLSLIHI